MHSDVETLERIELIRELRLGVYDVLVGINLLREGLDIPECGLVAILDADKEGFLRSEDRKSTRLNSSHANISYAVFCLKKKKNTRLRSTPATSTCHRTPRRTTVSLLYARRQLIRFGT